MITGYPLIGSALTDSTATASMIFQTDVYLRKTGGESHGRFSLADLKAIGGTPGGAHPLGSYSDP